MVFVHPFWWRLYGGHSYIVNLENIWCQTKIIQKSSWIFSFIHSYLDCWTKKWLLVNQSNHQNSKFIPPKQMFHQAHHSQHHSVVPKFLQLSEMSCFFAQDNNKQTAHQKSPNTKNVSPNIPNITPLSSSLRVLLVFFPRKLKAMDSVTGQTLFQESNQSLGSQRRGVMGVHVSNEKRSQTVGPGLYRGWVIPASCIGIIWSIMK